MSVSTDTHARIKATEFRALHGLGTAPIGDLLSFLEELPEIDVAIIKATSGEHGITMRDPRHNTVIIAAATTDRPMRQRSSLAHELAHVLFQDWAVPANESPTTERSIEESRANAFARHLLIPVAGLKEMFSDCPLPLGLRELSQAVQRFQVSPAIAAIAIESAGLISQATKETWRALTTPNLAVRFGWIDDYRALQKKSQQVRAPQKLVARSIVGYELGVVNSQTIATLRGTNQKNIEDEFTAAGILPRQPGFASAADDELPTIAIDLMDEYFSSEARES